MDHHLLTHEMQDTSVVGFFERAVVADAEQTDHYIHNRYVFRLQRYTRLISVIISLLQCSLSKISPDQILLPINVYYAPARCIYRGNTPGRAGSIAVDTVVEIVDGRV